MKKRTFPILILLLVTGLASSAIAQVVVNGTPISQVVLNGVPVTNLSIVQDGGTLTISTADTVDPCEDPESETCPGSIAFCEINPAHASCPGSTAFCSANPTHVSCPGSVEFCALPENVSHPSCVVNECPDGLSVFETLNWTNQPRKITVTTGKTGVASSFVTSGSRSYKGYFAAAADSLSGSLTRRMWFSECPGGAPIVRAYTVKGVTQNACDVTGVEPKLSWSQEANPVYVTQCKLQPNKQYFLNYSQAKYGTGAGPTNTSKMYRSSSTSGTP